MKKLKNDVFLRVILMFIGVFLVLFFIVYALLKHFILTIPLANAEVLTQTLEEFNFIWIQISLAFFTLMIAVFFILKNLKNKISEDLDALSEYMYEVSENKNYEKPLKIKHYLEFLQIAVGLKNLTKRLVQKDKKSSKR